MRRLVLVLLLVVSVAALGCGGSPAEEEEAYVQAAAEVFNPYMESWAVVFDLTAQSNVLPEDFENVKAVLADIVGKSEVPTSLSPPKSMEDAHAAFLQMFDGYGRAAEQLLLGFETSDPAFVSQGEDSLMAANEDLHRWVELMEPWEALMDRWIKTPERSFPEPSTIS